MYEQYFQLREKPFDIVPNPAYLYLSKTHRQAITYLQYGLQDRFGFVLMTGDVGSGKTMLIRELIRTLSPEINLARIFNTRVSSEELIAMINEDFGLDTAGKGKVLLLKDLYGYLTQEHAEGRRPVLIVDEAQNLSLDLLEEIRMLSNLETNDAKLLQILLVGQPELGRVLSLAEMRQLRQRISIACHLRPLTRSETEEYILHRLEVAGNREAVSFLDGAIEAVHAVSGGIPRQINTLCNFLLLTAYTEERRDVSAEMVQEVAAGLGVAAFADEAAAPEAPERAPHALSTGDAKGRLALLRALGAVMQEGEGGGQRSPGNGQLHGSGEYPESIRSIGQRLMALENEITHFENECYTALRQRLSTLETEVTEEKRDESELANDFVALRHRLDALEGRVRDRKNGGSVQAKSGPGTTARYPYCDVPEPKHGHDEKGTRQHPPEA